MQKNYTTSELIQMPKMHAFSRQFTIIYKVTYCSRLFIPQFLRSFDTQIQSSTQFSKCFSHQTLPKFMSLQFKDTQLI